MDKKKPMDKKSRNIIIGAVLMVLMPQIIIPLGILAFIFYLIRKQSKNSRKRSQQDDVFRSADNIADSGQESAHQVFSSFNSDSSKPRNSTGNEYTTYTSTPFDECPDTFCRHKDKGEHHLKHGKEIDPWDRPDIDISRYQHR